MQDRRAIDETAIRRRYQALAPVLDERARRLFAAAEALAAGRGGISAVSRVTGIARSTIERGLIELRGEGASPPPRVRRMGGGRKSSVAKDPTLLSDLEQLMERGDPTAPLRWTARSLRHLAAGLKGLGHSACHNVVAGLLRERGYRLQSSRKTGKGASHPDRNAQFAYLNDRVKGALAAGEPVIAVDTRREERAGDRKSGGRAGRSRGQSEEVRGHDCLIPELGRASPYGVCDIADNAGWVGAGTDHDMARFAADAIRRWWQSMGRNRYPGARTLLIAAEAGGHGPRARLWERELQRLANELDLAITVCHLPPGTSRWSRVEHRMVSFITQHQRGRPLIGYQVVVQLVAAAEADVEIPRERNAEAPPPGARVEEAEMQALNIYRHEFHGDWNYTIEPQSRMSRDG
ncbi:MAG TPA: ISAzo13 family transposase [Stellaceae bacterium]|nr:ISAzo13 family transposase [Stellaceae bacterium]